MEKTVPVEEAIKNNGKNSMSSPVSNEILMANSAKILNQFGKFQIRSILLFCPTFFCIGMCSIAPVFLNIIPDYQCKPPQYTATPSIVNNSETFETMEYNRNTTESKNQCFRIVPERYSNTTSANFVEKECLDGRVFNTSKGSTVVSRFDLVCDSAWKRPLTISSKFFGMFVGGMFGGQLSDKFGRRTTTLSCLLLLATATIAQAFSFDYWFYACCMFFTGITSSTAYFCIFTWAQEIASSGEKRAFAALALNSAYSIGGMMCSLIAYLFPSWDWILRIIGILYAMSFPALWLNTESPKWLLQNKKKTEAALQLLKRIAQVNSTNIDRTISLPAPPISQKQQGKNEKSPPEAEIKLLWRNPVLRRRLILVCLLWQITILTYYTMALNSANLGGSSYINNLIGCFVDLIAAIAVTILLKKFGRKHTLATSLFTIGCTCIASPKIREVNLTAGIVCSMAGRLFTTSSMFISVLYTGEMFPTLQRNTSVLTASMTSRIISLFGPFLIFAGEEIDLSIPFYVMGGMSTLAVYFTLILPETSGSLLPNTLKEAMALKDPRLLPRCKKLSKTEREELEDENHPVSAATDLLPASDV